MPRVPLSEETRKRTAVLFQGENLRIATELLVNECGSNLPFCENYRPGELDRIRFAALKLSEGRLDRLRDAIELAKRDWRELLMGAGFGFDASAHKHWIPDARECQMPAATDRMIAALNSFEPDSEYEGNQFGLHEITSGFEALPDRERVVPAMFSLIERFPEHYLGTPGPLVHCIESFGVDRYERMLIESVRRQPSELNVWMVNRILNTSLGPDHRERLLAILRSVPQHPKAPPRILELAKKFLAHQAKRHAPIPE